LDELSDEYLDTLPDGDLSQLENLISTRQKSAKPVFAVPPNECYRSEIEHTVYKMLARHCMDLVIRAFYERSALA